MLIGFDDLVAGPGVACTSRRTHVSVPHTCGGCTRGLASCSSADGASGPEAVFMSDLSRRLELDEVGT